MLCGPDPAAAEAKLSTTDGVEVASGLCALRQAVLFGLGLYNLKGCNFIVKLFITDSTTGRNFRHQACILVFHNIIVVCRVSNRFSDDINNQMLFLMLIKVSSTIVSVC